MGKDKNSKKSILKDFIDYCFPASEGGWLFIVVVYASFAIIFALVALGYSAITGLTFEKAFFKLGDFFSLMIGTLFSLFILGTILYGIFLLAKEKTIESHGRNFEMILRSIRYLFVFSVFVFFLFFFYSNVSEGAWNNGDGPIWPFWASLAICLIVNYLLAKMSLGIRFIIMWLNKKTKK